MQTSAMQQPQLLLDNEEKRQTEMASAHGTEILHGPGSANSSMMSGGTNFQRMGVASNHSKASDHQEPLIFYEKEPDTANFIEEQTVEDEQNDRDTTVDIQLTILNGLRVDPDFANDTFVTTFETT